ncbi:hypothetical protein YASMINEVIRUS_400 [Yasminevirus sp. GU-2018]|uniref:Uncharacterized protein n=1 Tax=Yasminevirus sp. GU-2018 TaxID=2420051 RepID=A0A5K0U7Y9_9VIRU|nr:hypothetical protein YASMINEVIRUS_400 [Yasminevirus sp. GU-2018]
MIYLVISMSHKEETSEGYPFEKKKRLASKISDMRDKPTLRRVREIILAENPMIATKKSNNGYLMFFQNYTEDTYVKLERLLAKVEKERLEQQARSITETSDHMLMSSEDPNADYTMSRTRLRYSNREKRLIKRQQREDDIINENTVRTANTDDDNDIEDDNVNVQKNVPKITSKTKVVSKTSSASTATSAKMTKTAKGTINEEFEGSEENSAPIKVSAKGAGKTVKPVSKPPATKVTAKSTAGVKPKSNEAPKKPASTIFTKMKA